MATINFLNFFSGLINFKLLCIEYIFKTLQCPKFQTHAVFLLFCFGDLSAVLVNALSTIRVQRRIIPATFESRIKKLKVDIYLCI